MMCMLLFACAFSGCLGSDDSANNTTNNSTNNSTDTSVTVITVEKEGLAIGANEKIQISLPTASRLGYRWVAENVSGLNITSELKNNPATAENGSADTIFTITADKEGSYIFKADCKHVSSDTPTYTITQQLDYAAPIDSISETPNLILTYEGIPTPKTGGVVEIRTRGNPTTGYTWIAPMSENGMLRLLDSTYVEDEHEEGMTGVGGTYIWYVTSDIAGTYMFDAIEFRGTEEPVSKFYFNITFV
ncbi:protease inhibitor I42 family protein [Methanimicrococcus blatticola]|nr:protease inhibitor I42 family protein [Methanimicrococcus blatticola]